MVVDRLKEFWSTLTERRVDYGVFETNHGSVIVQVPRVDKLTKTQITQGSQWYWRRAPWGAWQDGGFNLEEGRMIEKGMSLLVVGQAASEKFRRFYY